VDIASMANSLEVRCPFLDPEVVECAFRIPGGQKIHGIRLKAALKKAFRGLLPERILRRGKKGFGIPLGDWFRGVLAPLVDDVILARRARERGLIEVSEIRRLAEDHRRGRVNAGHRLWILLCLELWFQTYLDPAEPAPVRLDLRGTG